MCVASVCIFKIWSGAELEALQPLLPRHTVTETALSTLWKGSIVVDVIILSLIEQTRLLATAVQTRLLQLYPCCRETQ